MKNNFSKAFLNLLCSTTLLFAILFITGCKNTKDNVATLPTDLQEIRKVDERLVSYNVEMTEVTGGTFWKSYTDEQIDGTESFSIEGLDMDNLTGENSLMERFPPINLYDKKLISLTNEIGPAWIRVSGTWATKTYYDFDNSTNGVIPEGYESILTREQWIGVLDFVKAVDGKLLISVSNCEGDHPNGEAYNLKQAEKIFAFSHDYGVDIDAVEFMNEPNMLSFSGSPVGYTSQDFVRDQDIFNAWVKENYPDCLIVGPCNTDKVSLKLENETQSPNFELIKFEFCSAEDLLEGAKVPLDVYSYHCYNGASERIKDFLPHFYWGAEKATSDEYLDFQGNVAKHNATLRDKYVPGGQMWITESADAFGGGTTWGSTYLDVLRQLNELGNFSTITDGVIFHNTLASSDYGFLQHGTFEPRPNYFASVLWNRLMGTTVYDASNTKLENAKLYCHSRRDGNEGLAYLIINQSLEEPLTVNVEKDFTVYTLTGDGSMRSQTVCLNGKPLALDEQNNLPDMNGIQQKAGTVELAPGSCTFIITE